MPLQKTRLSRAEKKCYLVQLQQLEGEGIEVGIFDVEELRSVEITVGRGPVNSVFDLPSGGVGYDVWVSIVGLEPGEGEIELVTDYDDQIMLETYDLRKEIWRLGRRDYHRTEVLNPFLDPCVRFHRRGQKAEGVILATGLMPIPPEYGGEKRVPLRLIFRDQLGTEFTQQAELDVDRSAKREIRAVQGNRLREGEALTRPAEMAAKLRVCPLIPRTGPATEPDLGKSGSDFC